jgi:hypothetical protein
MHGRYQNLYDNLSPAAMSLYIVLDGAASSYLQRPTKVFGKHRLSIVLRRYGRTAFVCGTKSFGVHHQRPSIVTRIEGSSSFVMI